MPVEFEELEGSPQIRLSRQELTGLRIFKIAWSDWPAFIADLWGYWLAVGDSVIYVAGSSFAGLPGLWPSDIRIEPFQPDSPLPGTVSLSGLQNVYADAKVTVQYAPFPGSDGRKPRVPNGTFLVASGEVASQSIALPGRTWKWPDGTIVEDDVSPGLLVPEETIKLLWRWVPQPPWSAMRSCRGCVNNATFMGYDAEQVLFIGANWEREFQVNDTPLWRVDYRFHVRNVQSTADPGTTFGHNYFYRRNPNALVNPDNWQRLASVTSGAAPFASVDFSQLFEFGS